MFKNLIKYLPALLGLLLYLGTVNHGYVLDDNLIITNNEYVNQGISGISDIVSHNYAHGFQSFNDGLYRPLSVVSFAIEQSIFGAKPGASHIINALLYALAIFALTLFLIELTSSEKLAIFIAILYAVHPIHTEVVANLKGRDEIMALLFLAYAGLFAIKSLKNFSSKYLISLTLFFTLALFSKESSITFLGIFALLAWFFQAKKKALLPFSVSVIIPVLVFLLVRSSVLSSAGPVDTGVSNLLQNPIIENDGLIERISTASSIQWLYFQKLFIPINLAHDYSFSAIPVSRFNTPASWLGFLSTAILLAFGIIGTLKRKLWGFGILFYFITIAVVANVFILIGAIAAERFVFLPSLSWAIVVAMLIFHLKNETLQKAFLGAIAVIFAILTINRAADWQSNFTLFTGDVAKVEQSARAHYNAATAYNDQANIEPSKAIEYRKEAVKHHTRAIEIWPEYQDAYNNLSIVYLGLGQNEEAIKLLQTMLKKYPEYTKAYYNLAIAALKSENYALTESAGEAYLNRTQNNELLFIVAEAEGFQGKFDEAKAHLETLIKLEPGNSRGYLKLGMANAMSNNPEMGLYYLQQGLAVDHQNTEILFNIALIHLNTGNPNEALRFLNQVLVIEPNNQKALNIKNQLII